VTLRHHGGRVVLRSAAGAVSITEDAFNFASMTWTGDGRLALLTRLNDRPVLRIWRLKPGVYALPLLCRSAGQYALIAG
jgi:hypothetical protein